MLRTMTVVAMLALALYLPPSLTSWGAEVEGKIQAVNTDERTVTLDNGARLWLPDTADLDVLKEGVEIKASYEERDGKNVVTDLEVK